jgi:hypothetical protein
MTEPLPLFPPHRVDPVEFSARQRRLFSDRNLRIGRSSTVHAVIWVDWINGLTLPGPACGQGWSGLGATGELLTTGAPGDLREVPAADQGLVRRFPHSKGTGAVPPLAS